MSKKQRSRETRMARQAQIIKIVELVGEGNRKGGLTINDLASIMDLRPSQWLRDVVTELVEMGRLEFYLAEHRPGQQKRIYTLAKDNE